MFRTALPFGYLAQLILFVGALGLAGLLVVLGAMARNATLRWAGAGVAGITLGAAMLAARSDPIEQWTPRPIQGVAILGEWQDGKARLVLRADSTFVQRDEASAISVGRWNLADWNLTLTDTLARADQHWRVVVADSEYRLILEPGDPDTWDGDLGFAHVPRAAAPRCEECD